MLKSPCLTCENSVQDEWDDAIPPNRNVCVGCKKRFQYISAINHPFYGLDIEKEPAKKRRRA